MARTSRKREELTAAAHAFEVHERPGTSAVSARPAMTATAPAASALRPKVVNDELGEVPHQVSAERVLKGHIDLARWPRVKGWVWDPAVPGQRIRLDLVEGRNRLLTTAASVSRPDIAMAGIGDGLYGFEIDLHDGLLSAGRHVLSVRCADTGTELPGSPIILDVPPKPADPTAASVSRRALDQPTIEEPTRSATSRTVMAPPPVTEPASVSFALASADAAPLREADNPIPEMGERLAADGHQESPAFQGFIDGIDAKWRLSGWAYDPAANEPLVVELVEGETVLATARAAEFRPDLLATGVGQGTYAFYIRIPASLFDGKFHNLRVYGVGSAHREPIGKPFGIVLPRIGPRHGAAQASVPAIRIFEQVSGISAPMADRPSAEVIEETSSVLRQLGLRFGHAAALGLLYAYVLRRPIDNDGLVTRLTRIHSDVSEYKSIVQEVLYSDEAQSIHGPSRYLSLHPLEFLGVWLDGKFGILELPAQ
jgi:hypothetical protein